MKWKYKILTGLPREIELELNRMCESPAYSSPAIQGMAVTDKTTTVIVYYGDRTP